MEMHNPAHPGEIIYELYLKELNLSCRALAKHLNVSPSTLNRIIKKQSTLSPEMALRLSKVLGSSPESWLAIQDNYNLWHTKKHINLNKLHKLPKAA